MATVRLEAHTTYDNSCEFILPEALKSAAELLVSPHLLDQCGITEGKQKRAVLPGANRIIGGCYQVTRTSNRIEGGRASCAVGASPRSATHATTSCCAPWRGGCDAERWPGAS